MLFIRKSNSKGVVKNGFCFIKGNAVFRQVVFRFCSVPLKG